MQKKLVKFFQILIDKMQIENYNSIFNNFRKIILFQMTPMSSHFVENGFRNRFPPPLLKLHFLWIAHFIYRSLIEKFPRPIFYLFYMCTKFHACKCNISCIQVQFHCPRNGMLWFFAYERYYIQKSIVRIWQWQ